MTVPHARVFSAHGLTLSISAWAEELGVLRETIRRRLDERPKDAFERGRLKSRTTAAGVYWRPKEHSWEAKFRHGGRLVYIGLYPRKKDALAAVKRKRLELEANVLAARIRRNQQRASREHQLQQLHQLVQLTSAAIRVCPIWALDRRGKRTQTNHRRLPASCD